MSNPLLEVADLTGVVEFARTHGLVSIVDNTFASPVNFKPVGIGFDLVIYSATKYLNGHSDIVGGAIAGGAALLERITRKLNHLGGCMDPHAAFLLDRGIKTLALRMRQHNASALRIAQFLESHRAVRRVNYPGLQTHPRHQRAASLFSGFGGVLSFELDGTAERAERFLARTTLPAIAPSLGGIETLLTRPATTSHSGLAPVERQRLGISDRLIRLSVGIEATEDLIEDLNQLLERVAKNVRTRTFSGIESRCTAGTDRPASARYAGGEYRRGTDGESHPHAGIAAGRGGRAAARAHSARESAMA